MERTSFVWLMKRQAELTVLGPKGAKLAVGGEEDIHGG